METAVQWLESRRPGWSYASYCAYRNSLFRFEKYLLSGSISRTMCYSIDQFACRDVALKMPKRIYETCTGFRTMLYAKFGENTAYNYTKGCNDFLLFIVAQGCVIPEEITIDLIIEYSPRFSEMTRHKRGKKGGHLAGIVNLLEFLAERGDIPFCYADVLPRNKATTLSSLKLKNPGKAFQPSKKLEPIVPEFLSSLDEMRYNASSKQFYSNDLTNFFLFLEINHLEYSRSSIGLWLESLARNTLWERRRHTLTLFADYLETGSTNKKSLYTWKPLQVDSLPEWSHNIIMNFIAERQCEGLSPQTLIMCRSAGYRLFSFLDSKGICNPSKITPELVKEFHNTDKHATPESKNAYGIKVRQLLAYMAEQKLVPQKLFLAISTQCAPRRNIVSVMSDEMVDAVFDHRNNAATPLELRDAAVVMLGLRTGLRASDIVSLKIESFDWSKRTVSLVQQKTLKAITLPVPIDVGNSVYKYIMDGRPHSGVNGVGYVFVRHLAPFGAVTRQICRNALKRILSAYALELPHGQGFHITRKTFATRLLTSRNSIDDISNALGHAHRATAEVYLERDEEGMRLCPLPFESVGAI
jgi:site-specific recombinase XerD